VGPTAKGVIPQPSVERLKAMGDWMDVNGAAIYGAEASPFEAPEWGRFTQKDGFIYAHVFEWPEDGKLTIPAITAKKAYLLADDENELMMNKNEDSLEISLPSTAPDPIASVVVLETE